MFAAEKASPKGVLFFGGLALARNEGRLYFSLLFIMSLVVICLSASIAAAEQSLIIINHPESTDESNLALGTQLLTALSVS